MVFFAVRQVLYASASYLLYAADICGSERLSCGTLGTEFAFSYMDVPEGLLIVADISRILPVLVLAGRFGLAQVRGSEANLLTKLERAVWEQGKLLLLWAAVATAAVVYRADVSMTNWQSNIFTFAWRALEIAIVYAPFAARTSENAEKGSNDTAEPTTSKEAKSL